MDDLIILFIALAIRIAFGAGASAIAKNKHRDPVGWFFGGFFFQLIGIIIVAVLNDPEADKNKHKAHDDENRRLREQLRQERVKNEVFRQQTYARLDVHDEHLNLDTRGIESSEPAAAELTDMRSDEGADDSQDSFGFKRSSKVLGDSDRDRGPVLGRFDKDNSEPSL